MTTTSTPPTAVVVRDLPVVDLGPHPRNPRFDVGDVTELADSVAEIGLLEPLIVAPTHAATDPPYILIAGHRRKAAAEKAGLTTVPCLIRRDLDTPAKQLEAMLVENLQRTDLSPIEEACGYEQLKIYGYDPKRIAKATGRSKATVDKRLALMKLDETKRDQVHAHELTLADAEVFIEFAGDPEATKALESHLGTSNWKWSVERARETRDRKRKLAKELKAIRASGVTVIENPGRYWHLNTDLVPVTMLEFGDDADADDPHGTCPGHVAVLEEDGWSGAGSIVFACNKPAEHGLAGELTKRAGRDAETKRMEEERQQRMAEHARLTADLETARAVRDEFVGHLVKDPTSLGVDQLVFVLRAAASMLTNDIYNNYDLEVLAGALDIEVPDTATPSATLDLVNARIDAAKNAPAAAALWVAIYAHLAESDIRYEGPQYLRLLSELGHDLCDAERTLLERS